MTGLKMIVPGKTVLVTSKSLDTIRGKRGKIVRSVLCNANNVPGYIVEIDGRDWVLYAEEVEERS